MVVGSGRRRPRILTTIRHHRASIWPTSRTCATDLTYPTSQAFIDCCDVHAVRCKRRRGSASWCRLSTVALNLGGDCGQESYHTSCVDGCGGNRIDRLRSKDGDGVERAAAPTTAGLYAFAAAGTLCGPVCADAEVRLKE